jgi:hypothetical protein
MSVGETLADLAVPISIPLGNLKIQGSNRSSTLNSMENSLFDRTFRDSEGKIVLAQTPNLPLLVWGAASLLQFLVTSGKFHTGLELIAFGSLFTWAWQELFEGVNYFRRALGLVVLIVMLWFKL